MSWLVCQGRARGLAPDGFRSPPGPQFQSWEQAVEDTTFTAKLPLGARDR
jgi:hypothetical protein